jgi:protein TonB
MMELTQRRMVAARAPIAPANQQSRLVIALVLLLVALAAVLIKDRQFWFGSESTIVDADYVQPTVAPQAVPAATTQAATQTPTKPAVSTTPAPVHAAKKQVAVAATPLAPAKPADAPAVVSNRTALPPLDVEVIAGDSHHKVHPGSNSKKLEITNPAAAPVARQAAPVAALATNAAQHERLAEAIPPSYPPLAQHMNVQGSVVLQALIAADGTIENLHVMSGPAILASAAQQAVGKWKFKPVFQNGMAVETKATITVNFSIRVNDSSVNTTLAENNEVSISQ